ncbi:precorrin-8X methylmutase [Calderihabitans maritimus]|uniref:Precorrin-8x methylmutase cbic/cobh n=1 Tax=Calderihabitans maritimus TaxID=1246530 RepID=A0A1Z5HQG6_9FIRM|nr:precorrin-8X methylmutase [Calderihabitans maritimus]GAW91520.1 precorrin-8x methylmutase cbic/cobh [Calderihabitans maritimus]
MEFLQDPRVIENKSMEIIEELLAGLPIRGPEKEIVKRIIHTTGDPEVAKLVEIKRGAVEVGLELLRGGASIVTDVHMVKVGINKKKTRKLGVEIYCAIADREVAEEASRRRISRAMVAMERLSSKIHGNILAVGNSPTALFKALEMIEQGEVKPGLIVGTPVGFVGAKEAKEMLRDGEIPYITVHGTRGGSPLAVAIINALLNMV